MLSIHWLGGLLRRRPVRLLAVTAGVAAAVALLASLGTFLASSKATMTRRAASNVSLDWQVQVQPGADPTAVARTVASLPGVTRTATVTFGNVLGLTSASHGTVQTTGAGVVVAIPNDYRSVFPDQVRPLTGAGSGVLLAQQTASNLHASAGDQITIAVAGAPPRSVRVDGIVDLPKADTLFQTVGAPPGAQATAPPDNIVLVPPATFDRLFPPGTAAAGATHTQIHVARSHRLPNDPAAAFASVTGAARNLEVRLAGTGTVGDNLGATLDAARSDALYSQILFLFLGVPGAVLAALVTVWAAGSGAARRHRDQSLLRARGASLTDLQRLARSEAAAVGIAGVTVGLVVAAAIGRATFGSAAFGATSTTAVAWAAATACLGLALAWLSIALPQRRAALGRSVTEERSSAMRPTTPRWARFGADGICLAGAMVAFGATSRNGYHLVLAPEGVPTISVDYWAFAGPALLWVGAALLTWRLADLVLGRGRRPLAALLRPGARAVATPVAATLSRRRRLIVRAVVLVAMTTAFAASTAVFNGTYRAQANADARLTNGADVTVTVPPGSDLSAATGVALTNVPGVRHVEPLQHRYAYVGADLQDLYGVRPATIAAATKLQDAYFAGGTARQLTARLSARPDGILVSAETVHDYQLRLGDRLLLRLQDSRSRRLVQVPFHYIGIAKEFPTAPKDSFLVANATYVADRTGSSALGAVLIDTSSSPTAVAQRVRAVVGTHATVSDITTTRVVVGSSLTAVDLSGLTRVELGFALLLTATACGLIVGLGMSDNRRTLVIASALGATPRQLSAFAWSEMLVVLVGGLGSGAVAGWAVSQMLVKVLTGVFDPPPAGLTIPWGYLAWAGAVAVGAALTGTLVILTATRRAPTSDLRDL